ncbi:MAG TPA: M48 family metalloprotease [Gammaproteobacteria bacterium]|nr:M48 family metalloprotease [Gammaproteobacteria bacterium]
MKRRLTPAVFALAGLLTLSAGASVGDTLNLDLPDIGSGAGGVLSPAEEQQLGEAFMREIRQQLTILDDPEINEYIQSLGLKLVSNSDGQTQDFTFFIVVDPAINAFAAPGGFVGVNSGLILATQSESELASVLAHEIAHVTQHHLARAYEKADKFNLPTMAALVAAIVIGSRNSQLGQAAMAGVQAGSAQAQINFTRSNEEEADRIGMQTLAHSDFDARSMPAFFERLEQSARYAGPSLPEFLRTHPVTTSRIADTRNRSEQYPYRQVADSLAYHLVRAKLRVLNETNPKQSVKRFAESLKSGQYRNAQAEHYGYALALLANREYEAAGAEMRNLLAKDKDNLSYQLALAQIEMAAGHPGKAMPIYNEALKLYPGNNPLTLLYSRALLQTGQAAKAKNLLEQHVRHRNPEPGLYKLLAEAEGAAGAKAAAHQALAEYYYLNGQTDEAIHQLDLALQRKEADFYQSSQIEARLKQLQDEQAEAKKR